MDTCLSRNIENEIKYQLDPLGAYNYAVPGSILFDDNAEIDISNRLVLDVFDRSGVVASQACIQIDKPVIFYPSKIDNPYCFANMNDSDHPLWLTYDLGCFLALEYAGVQCAYLIPNRVIKKNQEIFKDIDLSIDTISNVGIFNDIRLIVGAHEVAESNKLINETVASVYFLNEPMLASFEPEYVYDLLSQAHDATVKTDVEKEYYDAWKIRPLNSKINQVKKTLSETDKRHTAAQCVYSIALAMQLKCPAFYSIADIKKSIQHELVHPKTIDSIIRRISYFVGLRKQIALKAVKASSWGKHKYKQVDSLENLETDTNVVLVTAPTGAGKTKHVITPFCNESRKNDERFLTVAPLRTLIHELAHKLGTDHYEKIKTRQQAELSESMAVCLPSIKSLPLKPFIDKATYLAIDEISQNLRYTAVGKITVRGADHESVFMQLKELVQGCKKVVAADASIDDMTLQFFEDARPGEQFTIVEQLPKNTGRECHIYEDMGDLIGRVEVELVSGGNVWIAVESADRAMALERFFYQHVNGDYPCMLICGDNSDDDKRKNFTSNIEEESRKYRIVIASPSISSGVSVEHRDNPHFTMIAGVASGHNIAPTDFMQMLARVRYVPDYHVCIMANNEKNNRLSSHSIVIGQKQAAELENKSIKENEFTNFKADVIVSNGVYRSDFANGFYWIMEYYKFNIYRHLDSNIYDYFTTALKASGKEIKNERIIALMTAPPFNMQSEADNLEGKANKTQEDKFRLEAHKMRSMLALGIDATLCERDIEMAQNIKRLVRFMRFKKHVPKQDDSEKNIALRRFDHAQVTAYEMVMGDIDLKENRFTNDDAAVIIEKVIENRFMLVALGIVPKKFGAWVENKKTKELMPFKKPAYPIRELNSILEMMGLKTRKREGTNEDFYQVSESSYSDMQYYYDLKTAS